MSANWIRFFFARCLQAQRRWAESVIPATRWTTTATWKVGKKSCFFKFKFKIRAQFPFSNFFLAGSDFFTFNDRCLSKISFAYLFCSMFLFSSSRLLKDVDRIRCGSWTQHAIRTRSCFPAVTLSTNVVISLVRSWFKKNIFFFFLKLRLFFKTNKIQNINLIAIKIKARF